MQMLIAQMLIIYTCNIEFSISQYGNYGNGYNQIFGDIVWNRVAYTYAYIWPVHSKLKYILNYARIIILKRMVKDHVDNPELSLNQATTTPVVTIWRKKIIYSYFTRHNPCVVYSKVVRLKVVALIVEYICFCFSVYVCLGASLIFEYYRTWPEKVPSREFI